MLLAGMVAAVVVCAMAAAAAVVPEQPTIPVEHVLVHEHAGYILRHAGQVVGNAWPRLARIALAAVVAVLTGTALGAVLSVVPFARSIAWRVARWSILTLLAWGLFAVLFLPPRALSVTPTGLRLSERAALLGQLSLPLPARARSLGRGEVAGIAAHLAPTGDTLRVTLVDGEALDLLLPHRDGAASAFVASALHDHMAHP
jgi:hypothetical protein